MRKTTVAIATLLILLLACVSCGKEKVPVHPLLEGFEEIDEYDNALLNKSNSTVTAQYLAHAVLNPWNEDAVKVAMETKTIRYYVMCATGHSSSGKWGDANLIVFPNGQTMLIDAGMAGFGPHLTRNLVKLGITKIDYLIFSHMHDDHAYGILGDSTFLENIEVGQCYWNGCLSASWSDPYKCPNTMARYNIPCEIISTGFAWDIGDVHLQVLAPDADWVDKTFSGDEAVNGTSILLRMDYGTTSFLFTGDMYLSRESDLVAKYKDTGLLDVDVMKLAHHGGGTSNSTEWIEATTPIVGVATGSGSVDTGIYGRYAKVGTYVYMDNVDGYVRIVSDGTNVTWDTSRERQISTYAGYDKIRDNVLASKAN